MLFKEQTGKPSVPVAAPPRTDLICGEIDHLALEHVNVLVENSEHVLLKVWANQVPNTLYEIGRLREIAFREKGEGTGRSADLDQFDLYYMHIVLWSKKRREIAGACRIGQVDIIAKRFGPNGLYTGTIFDYSPAFLKLIGPALEISKAFVRAEYRKSYSQVSLMWKGIGRFISYNPHYKVLIGPASISGKYSAASRQLIVSFLKKNNYLSDMARLMKPKTPGTPNKSGNRIRITNTEVSDIRKLSQLVSDIEPDGKGIPAHLKHYINLGGKIMGFSKDNAFGNTLNGLFLMDLTKCCRNLLQHCMDRSGLERFFDYHQARQDFAA